MVLQFYNPAEVAKALKVSVATVYNLMSRGELPYVLVTDDRRVIRADDLQAFIERRRTTGPRRGKHAANGPAPPSAKTRVEAPAAAARPARRAAKK